MTRAEAYWKKFLDRLEESEPLIFHNKDGSHQLPHVSFLGSIDKYKKVFMEANLPKVKRKKS